MRKFRVVYKRVVLIHNASGEDSLKAMKALHARGILATRILSTL